MPWSTKPPAKVKEVPEDIPDFTQDFLTLIKQITKENAVPTGWPVYRRGGSARHWTTIGANNYVPNGFTQIGVVEWTGVSATSGTAPVVFPRAYSGNPLAWINVIDTDADNVNVNATVYGSSSTGFTINWWSTTGVTAVRFSWLAMGPGASR
jgi:hypothetical protein